MDMNLTGRQIHNESPDWHDSAHHDCFRKFCTRAHKNPLNLETARSTHPGPPSSLGALHLCSINVAWRPTTLRLVYLFPLQSVVSKNPGAQGIQILKQPVSPERCSPGHGAQQSQQHIAVWISPTVQSIFIKLMEAKHTKGKQNLETKSLRKLCIPTLDGGKDLPTPNLLWLHGYN